MGIKKKLVAAGLVAIIAAPCIGMYSCSQYVKNNLEADAVHCNIGNQIAMDRGWALPKLKNEDMDGNGKYDSILLYHNQEGKRVFQKLYKNSKGSLSLGQPMPYEE